MLEQHRVYLDDRVRTLAYREAIRRSVTPDDVVIDLGSESGILAFFAAEAGARKVYAIESGRMAEVIALLARHLGYADRIEVVHGHSSKVALPERASLLVTETLGSLGLEEQILSSTIDARARLLREDARIIPRRIRICLVPVELPAWHAKHVAVWSEPAYGFDLSPLRVFAANTILATDIGADAYLAAPAELIGVDLATVTETSIGAKTTFEVQRDGTLHGFGGFFEATLVDGVTLDDREPRATSWRQPMLPIEAPIPVTRGTPIELELQTHNGDGWRWRGRAGGAEFDQTTWLSLPPGARSAR
jgi:type I protein arginine methyltransferase